MRIRDHDIDIPRLCQSIATARLALREYRINRLTAIQLYTGPRWSQDAATTIQPQPLNLLKLYCQIVVRNLVSHNPRVMMSTFDKTSKGVVAAMELWANQEIIKTNVAETLKRVTLDSLFTLGIAKVALATPADSASYGWGMSAGQPFVEVVDFDDFVFDLHAQRFDKVSFIGHRIRVPLESIRDSKLYSRFRKKLSESPAQLYNPEGDERVNTFGRTTISGTQEFIPHVELWEIYLPGYKTVITLAADQVNGGWGGADDYAGQQPLRVQEWVGPHTGPYHVLGYDIVPGNIMPIAPIMNLVDLHNAVNNCLRKIIRQAARQKEVTLVQGQTDDGDRVMRANDGEIISVQNPASTMVLKFGGPDPALYQVMQGFQQMFSWAAGNLDAMGGLSPQAKTASQEQLLATNSNRGIQDMQDTVVNFTSNVLKSLVWYWWNHPTNVIQAEFTVPGVQDVSSLYSVPPQARTMPFERLDLAVDPYSLRHSTPSEQMDSIIKIVTQIVVPMLPILQQQGVEFDVQEFLSRIAKYLNIPNLNEILRLGEPPQLAPGGGEEGAEAQSAMSPQTTRTYIRENRSGRTGAGEVNDGMERLMGMDKGGDPSSSGVNFPANQMRARA